MQYRYRAEDAPYNAIGTGNIGNINVYYRAFLQLPADKVMKEGKHYTVTIDTNVVTAGPFDFEFSTTATNWTIHSNQVGYRPDNVKIAYMDMYTGQGYVDFGNYTTFQVIDESMGSAAYSGSIVLSSANNRWTLSNIYSMDFSALTTPGTYHIYVPGVGVSYPFKINENIYKDVIGYTAIRGLFMQRDGAAGLDNTNYTNWNRPSAHLDDAIDEATGEQVDLTGGHMDAGDRGKYPWNSAYTSAELLTGAFLFPNQIETLGENLELPESTNSKPDYLDETVYELDWLYKAVMNTSTDGTLCNWLRPSSGGYEQGQVVEGLTGRVFFNKTQGPNIAETLYAAGALASAYNTPIMQKYYPEKCAQYLTAAKRAYNGFKLRYAAGTIGTNTVYDTTKTGAPHTWSDEMMYCAASLLQATADKSEYLHWITEEMPTTPDDYD